MPKKNSYITVTDQFCGAGGSSQGATSAGAEVKIAMNHWKLAIETHNTNFPNALHDCTDVSACDPRRYPSTDILITSPECTNHSLAKGIKSVKNQMDLFASGKIDPAAERSRATMWDVPRFAEYHKYNYIIVENVVDARKWVMFDAWLLAMHSLGYNHKCVYHNSMHSWPTPQSRDRMYVHFWRKGNKAPNLDYNPLAHCGKCDKNVNAIQTWKKPDAHYGKYRQQYVYCCPHDGSIVEPYYYAAFNCIDWSDIGKRIGDRKKVLSPNSIKRINAGLDKYGDQKFIYHSAYGNEARGVVRSINEPAYTQTTITSQAIVFPFIINDQHSTGIDCRVKSTTEHLPGINTMPHLKLVTPFLIKGEHSKADPQIRNITESMQTQVTRQTMSLVVPPLIIENKKNSTARKISEPLSCATTVSYHGLLTNEAWNSFIHYNRSQDVTPINNPVQTIATKEQNSLVTYNRPDIDDCYYRMLKPGEIKLAMAFGKEYIVLGSGRDQVKQCGNAVTPPAMQWQIKRAIESLSS